MRGRWRGEVGDDVRAGFELEVEPVGGRGAGAVPVKRVAVSAHLIFLAADALAASGGVLLDDMGAEVEELLEGEQVLVRLLSPLAEADENEVFLQVPFLFRERVEARVLDGDRGLHSKALRTLHLFGGEGTLAVAFREHRGADRLAVRDQRQGQERAHAACSRVCTTYDPPPAP